MTKDVFVAPLRIADEAFMVASTIERCPRQMMLRELVMNALEAAAMATDAGKLVKIDAVTVDGAPKLRIWNTGRGLSQAELLQISDLSSSLFKTVSLDGNFGMGAKVAALASNKFGLRYRSCRLRKVSQIVLGARDGVYGRLLQLDPTSGERREVIDVTDLSAANADDLSHDWTEVTLLGNSPDQNTVVDPYNGDPVPPRDWVIQTLGLRFMRLPQGVELAIEPSASGIAAREIFRPPLTPASFDRMEAVETENGVLIHYGYRAKDSELPPQRVNTVGLGTVVFDGEVYALTDHRRWALEAPTYGFSFAAQQCTVIVELPHGFGVRPEQYRQFLRFNEGDQHQLQFADFGDLVRRHIPPWLKSIIASMLPVQGDYLDEINDEMRRFLVELGLEDLLRAPLSPRSVAAPRAASEKPAAPPDSVAPRRPPRPPKRPDLPAPPEVIVIEDETDIVEKALGGRAARYYPAARQIFVNARYAAFARLRAQLADEFAPFADNDTVEKLAKLTAEWAIVQRIARNLLYSIGKPKSGWTAEEIKTAQSPEAMSLMVDDVDLLLTQARRRMAAQLGLDIDKGDEGGDLAGDPMLRRMAGELADAEARLQRAQAGRVRSLGPFYRQIGTIHIRQRNFEAARAWLEKGMATDTEDPWCRHEYAALMLAQNDLERAAEFSDQALALAPENGASFYRLRAQIETRRGNLARAEALLGQSAAQHPETPWFHYDLAALHLGQGNLEAAAAAADAAIERSRVPSSTLLRRRAEVDLRRGDLEAAAALFRHAQEIDPKDALNYYHLAKLEADKGEYENAIRQLEAAVALRPPMETLLHRTQSEIELKRGERARAVVAAEKAVDLDRSNAWSWHHLAGILLAAGDLDRAAHAAGEATRVAQTPSAGFYRRHATIEAQRGDRAAALELFEKALALAPNDPSILLDIAFQRLAQEALDSADEAAIAAEAALSGSDKARALILRARIASERKDPVAAGVLFQKVVEVAPTNAAYRLAAASHLLSQGNADAAAAMAKEALESTAEPTAFLLSKAAEIEERRGNWRAAGDYLMRGTRVDPKNPRMWSRLVNAYIKAGDLSAAGEAAEHALTSLNGGQNPEALEKLV